jgi:hypothetical protein
MVPSNLVRAFGLIALLSVVACNPFPPPTPEQVAKADYGTLPEDYQERIKTFIKPREFDPYSAVYEFKKPEKGYYYQSGYSTVAEFGYFVSVGINAKNRFGGYAGVADFLFFLKGDELKECYYGGTPSLTRVICRPNLSEANP